MGLKAFFNEAAATLKVATRRVLDLVADPAPSRFAVAGPVNFSAITAQQAVRGMVGATPPPASPQDGIKKPGQHRGLAR